MHPWREKYTTPTFSSTILFLLIFSYKKCVVFLTLVLLCIMHLFFLSASKIFYNITGFEQLNYDGPSCGYFHGFVCVPVLPVYWTVNLGFAFNISSNTFFEGLFLFLLILQDTWICLQLIEAPLILKKTFFFSLCFSSDNVYGYISLYSLTFSFAMCNLILIPSNVCFLFFGFFFPLRHYSFHL